MGEVWLADRDDGEVRQRVAIKLIRPGMGTADVVARFRRERQLLAALNHANIARLIDAGRAPDGRPYLVMEHVDGLMIDAYCTEHALDLEARLKLFLQTCAAVAHAHRNVIVHRDLKPSNILVTSDGYVKLLDFGISKLLDGDAGTTIVPTIGAGPLTPSYASPEQIRGDAVTTATDVYSLGVVLYELLSGRKPYEATSGSRAALERAVVESEPTKPSSKLDIGSDQRSQQRWKLRVRGDLDNIVLKAMRKEPSRRYQTVDALAIDIERHLAGRPVSARPSTWRYRTAKFIRRRRGPLIAASATSIVGTASAVAFFLVVVLMPKWSAEAHRTAQLSLIGQDLQAALYNSMFWNLPPAKVWPSGRKPGTVPFSVEGLDETLAIYDRAVALAWNRGPAVDEREALRTARMLITSDTGTSEKFVEQSAGATGRDARSAGLAILYSGDPHNALELLARYESSVDRDPFIEALIAEVYLVLERPELAYPRARAAYEAFPESRMAALAFAESAVGVGDVQRAKTLIATARSLPDPDVFLRINRIEMMILHKSGVDIEYRAELFQSAVADYYYARWLEQNSRFEEASDWYTSRGTDAQSPTGIGMLAAERMLAGYVRSTDAMIDLWTADQRDAQLSGVTTRHWVEVSGSDNSHLWGLADRLRFYRLCRADLLSRPSALLLGGWPDRREQAMRTWRSETNASRLADLLMVDDDALWARVYAEPNTPLVSDLIDAWVSGDADRARTIAEEIRSTE